VSECTLPCVVNTNLGTPLLQFRVLAFGLLQDRDIRIGVFPEGAGLVPDSSYSTDAPTRDLEVSFTCLYLFEVTNQYYVSRSCASVHSELLPVPAEVERKNHVVVEPGYLGRWSPTNRLTPNVGNQNASYAFHI
jgi:hypothetical protein